MEQVDLQDFEDMFCDDSERSKQAKEAFIRAVNDVPGGVAMLVFGTEFLLFAVSSVVVKGAILEKLNGGTQ